MKTIVEVFNAHGVKYLSPSSINRFAKNPAKWLVNVAGYNDRTYAPPFTYGNAIEKGITRAVMDGISVDQAVNEALEVYSETHQKVTDANYERYNWATCAKKQLQVKPTLEKIIPQYAKLGVPIACQKWVEHTFDNFDIPMRGILDLEYEHEVRDLKTASQRPKNNNDYNRQLTFYALATNKKPFIDYVYTLTKSCDLVTFEVPEIELHIVTIERIMNKMYRMLAVSDDIAEVCKATNLEPDVSNTNWWDYWGKNEREGAYQLFLK